MKIINPCFDWLDGRKPNGKVILDIITKAGRVAYQSDREGEEETFVRNLIRRGHESVLEHAKVSVVVACDRGVTHETVRHRIASYTQESTHYINYAGGKFKGDITYIAIMGGIQREKAMAHLSAQQIGVIVAEWMEACRDAEKHYNRMIELGATPRIARSVLNNSTKAQIVITMNMREWRHFFKLRSAANAHPQMREVAEMLLEAFKSAIPVIFDDIPLEVADDV
ncbi:MAG: FAD-dependent thymidylate synthase [Clostridia bacterium]|nr:FAD-dependent thymidylate synthase [Clostridia bacterium]